MLKVSQAGSRGNIKFRRTTKQISQQLSAKQVTTQPKIMSKSQDKIVQRHNSQVIVFEGLQANKKRQRHSGSYEQRKRNGQSSFDMKLIKEEQRESSNLQDDKDYELPDNLDDSHQLVPAD